MLWDLRLLWSKSLENSDLCRVELFPYAGIFRAFISLPRELYNPGLSTSLTAKNPFPVHYNGNYLPAVAPVLENQALMLDRKNP